MNLVVRLILACLCLATTAAAQNPALWRFWGVADGMKESYTTTIAIDAEGTVWAKHGDVDMLSILDGYSVRKIADPRSLGRVSRSDAGQIWTFDTKGLKQYLNGRWVSYPVPEIAALAAIQEYQGHSWFLYPTRDIGASHDASRISILPVAGDRVLILLPSCVLEYDAALRVTRSLIQAASTKLGAFLDMHARQTGIVWIAGEHGLGQLKRSSSNGVESYQFTEFSLDLPGFHLLQDLIEGDGGEVFASATSGSGSSAVVRFDGKQWQCLYLGKRETVRGWRGVDRTIWIQDGGKLMRMIGSSRQQVDPTDALSSRIFDMVSQPGGVFWLSTSQGMARYAPPLWRNPGPDAVNEAVNSITEDRAHRIWFAATTSLVSFDGQRWRTVPLPPGEIQNVTNTHALCVLKDGRIVIKTAADDHLLVFDPDRRSFRRVEHPGGKRIRMIVPRKDGTVWVTTQYSTSTQSILETFDGVNFGDPFGAPLVFDIADLRTICETAKGDLWLGGTSQLGVLSHGKFHFVGAREGYLASGAFVITEKRDGVILFGGRDKVFQFDGKNWMALRDGLDRARTIVEADDTVWIASGTGIHRYRNGEWVTNGMEEGLPSSIGYTVFRDSAGRMWAGTARGLSLFHPEADTDAPFTSLSMEQNLRETPPDGQVRLVFSGVDKWKYTLSERLLFSWRLDGLPWTRFTSLNFASYTHLPGGPHTFEVRAMDRNGNIDRSPAKFQFSVLFPWYRDSGFLLLAGVAAALIAFLIWLAISHYLSRGTLIDRLNFAYLVDQDRKHILELIAKREPLDLIFLRIAESVEKHCPGTLCSVLLFKDGKRHLGAGPSLPVEYRTELEDSALGSDSVDQANRHGLAIGHSVPIFSSAGALWGSITTYSRARRDLTDSDASLLESVCRLARAALENHELYEKLEHQSRHDSLTQLPNRVAFDERLQQALISAVRYSRRVAVLYIDLDRFKQINDSLGHKIGDGLLQQVSRRLEACLRKSDTLARIGGDEFTMVLPEISDPVEAERVAQRALEVLRQPFDVEGHELFSSGSIGIAIYPEHGIDCATLQRRADHAMYRAKARGKDQYEFFDPTAGSLDPETVGMVGILRRALECGQFELHYQPVFKMTGEVAAVEALIRLQHPRLGLLPPKQFITFAEESGLIIPIGNWAIRQACRQIVEWRLAGRPAVKIAVNVSALQLARSDFAETVARILTEEDVDAGMLELELTESEVMRNWDESSRQMRNLRALGLSIAIDDFGTGYSSLSYMHCLPVDTIKIDQSFVSDIGAKATSLPVVRTIVTLAHQLGLAVVAEGVETEDQLQALREIDCDLVQGFLLQKPALASALDDVLFERGTPESLSYPVLAI